MGCQCTSARLGEETNANPPPQMPLDCPDVELAYCSARACHLGLGPRSTCEVRAGAPLGLLTPEFRAQVGAEGPENDRAPDVCMCKCEECKYTPQKMCVTDCVIMSAYCNTWGYRWNGWTKVTHPLREVGPVFAPLFLHANGEGECSSYHGMLYSWVPGCGSQPWRADVIDPN